MSELLSANNFQIINRFVHYFNFRQVMKTLGVFVELGAIVVVQLM